mmetsp:Transcript_54543/g.100957  ORF Transcript_54543/g.100957 Transcript_54543/m.100957 type:complete len:196 (+) Transcript_54543:56-643(+)
MVSMELSDSPSAAIASDSGTEVRRAVPQQGALRTPADRPPVQAADRHITWNEENLAEHEKDRGTRQKIDEPPTPWVWSPAAASEDDERSGEAGSRSASVARQPKQAQGVDPLEVAARLAALETTEASSPNAAKRSVSKEDAPAAEAAVQVQIINMADATPKTSSASFRAKRARHYDEFRALQAAREQQATSDDSN